ncbi:hypothetical protein [Streptomyces sp. SID3343]|uniref:hypothetical protein n=1 Tax=Streptomyces sp. SID3343 TaxID=2690260 RepID=UPI00136E8931|nr:hypothetical protein [Streptomyces sp. SID3343]MYW04807.1 hypothetical protein [Streptomyces sp. SID3343]
MGLSIEDVETCSPDALDGVAAGWERLSAAMGGDKDTVAREVIAPLVDGGWQSEDGKRAVELLGYVGAQLDALRAESGAMASIVREAAGELRAAQGTVRAALDEARRNGLTVRPDGGIGWEAGSDAQFANLQSMAEGIGARLTAALQAASDADALATATLRANVDFGPKKDFNAYSLGADPAADARRSADLLARVNTTGLTEQEVQQLRLLTWDNAGDQNFQVSLLKNLGPKDLLVLTDGLTKGEALLEPKDQTEVARMLRETLSGASPVLAQDKEWMEGLRQAGTHDISATNTSSAPGYEGLALLMREGTYDKEFLLQVADGIVDMDATIDNDRYSRPDNDPVTNILHALNKDQSAATAFLSGGEGPGRVEHLISRVPAPHLETFAQTIDLTTRGPIPTPESSAIVGNVVNVLGKNPPEDVPEELQGPVGQMLARNIETVHLELSNPNAKAQSLVDSATPLAEFDTGALIRTISGISGDEKNIVPLCVAEDAYTATVMTVIKNESPEGQRLDDLQAAAKNYAEVRGTFSATLSTQIEQAAEDESRDVDKYSNWVQSAAGALITGVLPDRVGDSGERIFNGIAVQITDNIQREIADNAEIHIATQYDAASGSMQDSVDAWLTQNGFSGRDASFITDDMQTGFTSAITAVRESDGS